MTVKFESMLEFIRYRRISLGSYRLITTFLRLCLTTDNDHCNSIITGRGQILEHRSLNRVEQTAEQIWEPSKEACY